MRLLTASGIRVGVALSLAVPLGVAAGRSLATAGALAVVLGAAVDLGELWGDRSAVLLEGEAGGVGADAAVFAVFLRLRLGSNGKRSRCDSEAI